MKQVSGDAAEDSAASEQQDAIPSNIEAWVSSNNVEEKGVQEMLRIFNVTKIPDHYIQPLDRRLKVETRELKNEISVPVVDLASPLEELLPALRSACEYGFFQIINHGTSPDLMRRISSNAKEFFALPVEVKVKSSTQKKRGGPVYFGPGSKGDWRDVLKINCAPPGEVAMEFWPRQPEGFRDAILQYSSEKRRLAEKLLELISESLGLNKGYILEECGEPRLLVAMNYYPPCADPSLTIGIREHSDPNTITILLQDEVQSLQVYKDGFWIDVKPMEGALVVNIGDHLEILSNGRYPSCLHRVVTNKWKSRMSVAAFYSPSKSSHVKPAPPLLDEKHPAVFREFIYADFLRDFYMNGGANNKVILSQFLKPKVQISKHPTYPRHTREDYDKRVVSPFLPIPFPDDFQN